MRFGILLMRGLAARGCRVLALLLSVSQLGYYATSQTIERGADASMQGRTAGASTVGSDDPISKIDSSWETDSKEKIKLCDLNGSVSIIAMFYSTCEGVCAITVQDMQRVEASLPQHLREKVKFVLVTLDASHDTAEALRAYRRTESLSSSGWVLLRGDDNSTRQLAAFLGVGFGRDASGRFLHSSVLTVLDTSGRIIFRHNGLRADLKTVTDEVEAATGRSPRNERR